MIHANKRGSAAGTGLQASGLRREADSGPMILWCRGARKSTERTDKERIAGMDRSFRIDIVGIVTGMPDIRPGKGTRSEERGNKTENPRASCLDPRS